MLLDPEPRGADWYEREMPRGWQCHERCDSFKVLQERKERRPSRYNCNREFIDSGYQARQISSYEMTMVYIMTGTVKPKVQERSLRLQHMK
jgi:hypothetical protein